MTRRRGYARVAEAYWVDRDEVELRFTYDADLVDALKQMIPAGARQYDPDERTWTVRAPYARYAVRLVRDYFPNLDEVDDWGAASPPPTPPSGRAASFAILHLLPSAPPALVEAAYRCLARLHHPDVAPEAEKATATATMARINAAVAELRR